MVKLDVTNLRYLDKDEFRALTAVEMGMRNHELVPRSLIYSISGINNGSIAKILLKLTQNKLLTYERGKRYDGYRLTYGGYDYLALNVLRTRGVITGMGQKIGVGKESDVYLASNDEGRHFAVKFHRLGRTCFRKVSEKRDYQKKGQFSKAASWIYLSRLAAIREYAFMKLLFERNLLPIPEPIDYNRHVIVMELIDGSILNQVGREELGDNEQVAKLYEQLMQIIIKLANEFGVVHGDYNEFNILIKNNETHDPVMIDFPQMVSVNHELGPDYFERDVNCIVDFFVKRFGFESDFAPCFESLEVQDDPLNNQLKNLADMLDNEQDLIEHLEGKKKGQTDQDESKPLPTKDEDASIQTTEQPQDLMSKFFNSLPTNTAPSSELYYEVIDEDAIKQAQEKVMLENKLNGLMLSNIEEQSENDENAVASAVLHGGVDQSKQHVGAQVDDQFDRRSVHSAAYSTASTFSPHEVKLRLSREQQKRDLRNKMKFNPKNVKGDANALRRRKQNDQALANEDLHGYINEGW